MIEVAASDRGPEAKASVRALGRVDGWWYSKVAPVLAVSYCASLLYRVGTWATARTILTIAFVGLCAGTFGHLVNDVFDIEVDRRAGKQNHMAQFAPWQRFSFCAAAVVLGFLPGVLLSWSRTTFFLLGLEYLLPTIYSVPPLRLKGRGALGLVCDCFGAHLVPCLYAISLMAHAGGLPTLRHAGFVGVVGLWAFCLGLQGIVVHEFEDRDNDLSSGIKTFATETVFAHVRRPMTGIYGTELFSFLGIIAIMARVTPLLAVVALLYAVMVGLRLRVYWEHYRHVEQQATLIQWWQLSHPFYEAYFPLAVAIACTWKHPWLAVFPVLQLGVFAASFKRQLPALEDIWTFVWLGGRLDVSNQASARMSALLLPRPVGRVAIQDAGTEPWEIRVVRPGVRIRAGTAYRMVLRARADEARQVMIGVWQDHAPWECLGACEVTVSPEWQTVRREFLALQDDRRGCLSVWLGGQTAAVELGRWGIRRIFGRKR